MNLEEFDILIVTGSPERFSYLTATLGCLLPNVKNVNIFICFHYEISFHQNIVSHIKILQDVAKQYSNNLQFIQGDEQDSLGKIKAGIIQHYLNRKWVMFLDDDVMFSKQAIKYVFSSVRSLENISDYFVVEFVDVNNKRKHRDWDLIKRLPSEISGFESEKVIHHRWYEHATKILYGGSIFIVTNKSLYDNNAIEVMSNMKKGDRGYDVLVAQCYETKIALLGNTFWHCGMDTDFYNKTWTQIAPEAKKIIKDTKKNMEK